MPTEEHPWNITLEELTTTTAYLPDAERAEIVWAYNYSAAKNLGFPSFGAAAGISGDTLRRVAKGSYTDPRNAERQLPMPPGMAESIAAFRESSAASFPHAVQFVSTETSRKVAFNLDLARESRSPVFLMGASQIGKTTAILKYRDANPHNTVVVTVTSGMGAKGLAVAICEESGLSGNGNLAILTRRIGRYFSSDRLLVLDDFHVLTLSSTPRTFLAAMEFLRAVYGVNQCGMLFCTTDLDYNRILKDYSNALHQLMRRGIHRPHLGHQPLQKDVRSIIEAHGLRWPAKTMQVDGQRPWQVIASLAKQSGLKGITERLRYALKFAGRAAVPVTWAHFVRADAAVHSNTSAPADDWT
jgi:DNA transposition AAA+ family ATPase